jgi:hypothetical protein
MAETTFNYPETVVLPSGEVDSITQICATCLGSGPRVQEESHLLEAVESYFNSKQLKAEHDRSMVAEILQRLARNPRPLMAQGTDWPICHDDFCELYSGGSDDADLSELTLRATFWDHGPVDSQAASEIMVGEPEFGEDVLLFRCLTCSRRYFTFQPT